MLDRLDEAGFRAQFSTDDIMSTLPDPELYIIVDGRQGRVAEYCRCGQCEACCG